MNIQMIEMALLLATKSGYDQASELLSDHLVAKFPSARLKVVALIVTRACALARQGHDRLDREMFTSDLLDEIGGLGYFAWSNRESK